MKLAKAAFWASAGGGAWVVAGYPLALALLPPAPWRKSDRLPAVSVIVPAFHERRALARKLRALDRLDYPRDLVQVIVACDEDPELARIASRVRPDATVLFAPRRGGKAAGMNRGLRAATGEVVVFTDANNILEPQSLRAAVRHLGDPAIWAVAGRRGEARSAYARYEDVLRALESRSGSVAGMSGEFIAIRRDRAPALPADVVNDDLWLLCELVAAGGRVVYEPAAGSVEPALNSRDELERRARMGAGRWLVLSRARGLPLGFAIRIVSHKAGRLALPAFLLGALGSSLALARQPRYGAVALAQLVLYLTGAWNLRREPRGPIGRAARELVVGCAGTAIGLVRGVRGRQDNRWAPVR